MACRPTSTRSSPRSAADHGAPFEQTDIHSFKAKQGDQFQDLIVREQRKSEVGAREFEFHVCPLRQSAIGSRQSETIRAPTGVKRIS